MVISRQPSTIADGDGRQTHPVSEKMGRYLAASPLAAAAAGSAQAAAAGGAVGTVGYKVGQFALGTAALKQSPFMWRRRDPATIKALQALKAKARA